MKIPQRPLARVIALTTAVVVVGGAAAVADTVPVTHSVVNGFRSLAVTGSNGTAPVGPPSLTFNSTTASAPFGIVVSDLMYERKGYSVNAVLSNLYKLDADGINCNAAIPSTAFGVTFDPVPTQGAVKAVLDTTLTFVEESIKEELLAADPMLSSVLSAITGDLPVTVPGVKGVVQEVVPSFATPLISVGNDGLGGSFTAQSEHPGCVGSGAASPTSVGLQTGAKNDPTALELTALHADIFDGANTSTTEALTVAEAMAAGLLPTGADSTGGTLFEATKTAVKAVIDAESTLVGLVSDAELLATTDAVVDGLLATSGQLVLDLIGQTGVYTNLPKLNLDTAKAGDPTTGAYHGVMTVTLVD